MMNDSDQIVSLAQVAKDLAKGGNNFLDESTREFEVTSEEEKEDLNLLILITCTGCKRPCQGG
jgi:hypothetical protein